MRLNLNINNDVEKKIEYDPKRIPTERIDKKITLSNFSILIPSIIQIFMKMSMNMRTAINRSLNMKKLKNMNMNMNIIRRMNMKLI